MLLDFPGCLRIFGRVGIQILGMFAETGPNISQLSIIPKNGGGLRWPPFLALS